MPELTPETIKELVYEAVREALGDLPLSWPRWLPIEKASLYSGLSPKTLRKLYREGEIYARNLNGGKLLFDRESIDDFMLREKAYLQAHLDLLKRSRVC